MGREPPDLSQTRGLAKGTNWPYSGESTFIKGMCRTGDLELEGQTDKAGVVSLTEMLIFNPCQAF